MAKINNSLLSKSLIEFQKSYLKILENVQSPLQEVVESITSALPKIDVPMQALIECANQVSNVYSEILNTDVMQRNLKSISDIIIKTEDILSGIDISIFTSSQEEDIEIAEANLNEVNQIVTSPSSKSLSWDQWLVILGLVLQLLGMIKDYIPNTDYENIQSQIDQIIIDNQDYHRHSLENQSLFLENQDTMIENQETMIENQEKILQNQEILIDLQEQNQCNSQKSD